MAEIKDKVITAESLKTLHEYDKNTYATKESIIYNSINNRTAISTDGINYVVKGEFSKLEKGMKMTITPNMRGASAYPKIQLVDNSDNNVGEAKNLIMPIGGATTGVISNGAQMENWLIENAPVEIKYDGERWKAEIYVQDANSLYGNVPLTSGGTGANNGAEGLKNLFAAGITVLSSNQYGNELPTAGTAGRIFFKKLTDT